MQIRPVNPVSVHFGRATYRFITNEQVSGEKGYAKPEAGGSEFLRLYTTPDPSGKFNWYFAHRENAKAAMHILPIVKDKLGREYLHVIVQKAPAMGGRPIVQLPAGLWGDKGTTETAKAVARRELREETGYQVKASMMPTTQLFASSPGMTTEQKTFAVVLAKGEQSNRFQEPSEQKSIVAQMDIPIDTIRDYGKYIQWLNQLNAKGFTIGMDILAARALLPPAQQIRALNRLG